MAEEGVAKGIPRLLAMPKLFLLQFRKGGDLAMPARPGINLILPKTFICPSLATLPKAPPRPPKIDVHTTY